MDISRFQAIAQAIRDLKSALGRIEKELSEEKVKFEEEKVRE